MRNPQKVVEESALTDWKLFLTLIRYGSKLADRMAVPPPPPGNSDSEKSELFPATRWTLVLRTLEGDSREEALAELCRMYWSPVYFFIRKRGRNPHDAEDLTQGFFARMLNNDRFQKAASKPGAGRLRSYLLKGVQNYLIDQHERDTAQKRGGTAERISIESNDVEQQFARSAGDELSPEEMFDRRWAANVLERTFVRLEQEYENAGKAGDYAILRSTLEQTADQAPFSEIGRRLGTSESGARVAAFRLRKQFRAIVHEEIRETTISEEDFQDELNYLRHLLGG